MDELVRVATKLNQLKTAVYLSTVCVGFMFIGLCFTYNNLEKLENEVEVVNRKDINQRVKSSDFESLKYQVEIINRNAIFRNTKNLAVCEAILETRQPEREETK